jgi:hypothetical protein
VPGHRFLFAEVDKLAANQSFAQPHAAPMLEASLAKNIDIAAIIAQLLATSGDTSFEQLDCIGFDPNRDALIGVTAVHGGSADSPSPCHFVVAGIPAAVESRLRAVCRGRSVGLHRATAPTGGRGILGQLDALLCLHDHVGGGSLRWRHR